MITVNVTKLCENFDLKKSTVYIKIKALGISYTVKQGLFTFQDTKDYEKVKQCLTITQQNKCPKDRRTKALSLLKKAGNKGVGTKELQDYLKISESNVEALFIAEDPVCTDGNGPQTVFYYIDWSKR